MVDPSDEIHRILRTTDNDTRVAAHSAGNWFYPGVIDMGDAVPEFDFAIQIPIQLTICP